jgi:hypothetical protein
MRRNAVVLFVLFLALQLTGLAQVPTPGAARKATEFYPLEEVRTGQKGVARTVFAGAEPEEFNLEILGVMPGFPAPRKSVIIAKLSGAQVERTSVFAGMSGSPVFIDGKLVGAIAYAFPFSKEPIAGITPIKQMIEMFEQGRQTSGEGRDQMGFLREPRAVSYAQLSGTDRWRASPSSRRWRRVRRWPRSSGSSSRRLRRRSSSTASRRRRSRSSRRSYRRRASWRSRGWAGPRPSRRSAR